MATKSICITCRHRHDFHVRKLTKKEAFCLKMGKTVKSKKNCIQYTTKE